MGESSQEATIRRLSQAVGTWEIGVFEHDHQTDETWASPRFREMLGFEPDEPIGMVKVARLSFPADVEMIQAAMHKVNDPEGDGIFDLIYRVVRRDGEVRWVHGRGVTTFGEVNGKKAPLRSVGTILDVTEQHELKLAVERHELRLTQATTASQIGVFDLDHDPARPEDAVYWSPTYRKMSGFDLNAPPDINWYVSRVHPDDQERFRLAIEHAYDPQLRAPYDIEYRWLHPNGEVRWCVARSTTTFHNKGPHTLPQRTVGAILDITPNLHAAEQLSQRSALLDATPDIVCIADPRLRLVFMNQAARSFGGVPADREVGEMTLTDVVGKVFEENFLSEGRAAAVRNGSWQTQVRFTDHQQREHPVSALVLCHRDRHGALSHFSLVARDLTHEKELEEQVRRSQKMEVIGRLAGGVAHDFNNILSVIMGFSDVLEDKLADLNVSRRELQEIRFAAERAAALTRQLLTISRNEFVRPRAIDLNDVVRAAEPMFRRLIDARVDIQFNFSEAPARIKGDPSQIEQVLLNLIVNARDAMPAGGELCIEVSQVIHRSDTAPPGLKLRSGPYVVLRVSDSGHGISPEVRSRLFEPFFTTKEQGKGTGLGLATVQNIVDMNQGAIWLHSELHKGTTFKVYLPSTDEPLEHTPEQAFSPVEHGGGTLLLVEDEAQLRAMLTIVLVRAGYRVLEASGPVEALGLAEGFDGPIHLLVTDVVMPQMTGPVLAAELKDRRPEMLVLFMSGYTEDVMLRQGIIDEEINFLQKPLSASVLLRTVAQLMISHETRVA